MTYTPYSPAIVEWLRVSALNQGHTIISSQSQRYNDGYWNSSIVLSWNQQLNTGALAACMWKYSDPSDSNRAEYRQMAIETIERAFRINLYEPVGYPGLKRFVGNILEGDTSDPSTGDTINFEVISALCGIMHYLGDSIDVITRRRWSGYLSLVLDYYTAAGGYPYYYINGNYAIHLTGNYWEVAEQCRLCGDMINYRKHLANYETMWDVTLTPYPTIALYYGQYEVDGVTPYTLWQGFGLVVDGGSKNEDWSNYTTHLSETSSGPIHGSPPTATFDGAYSLLTMDIMACLFVRNRDGRFDQLLNGEFNKLSPLINTTVWTIDCTNGSRQTGVRGYTGGWLQIMYILGSRTSNRTMFTDANIQNSWSAQVVNNNQNLANGQVAQAQQRDHHIVTAAVIEACASANLRII